MAMLEWECGTGMVVVTLNDTEYQVSNKVAAAFFRSLPGDGRVFPVTSKVNAAQKAWIIEQCELRGMTQSALIASLIEKEMTKDGH